MWLNRGGWFRGGLVFKAHILLFYSTLGSRVIKNKKRSWWELDPFVDVMKQRVEMVLHLSRAASVKHATAARNKTSRPSRRCTCCRAQQRGLGEQSVGMRGAGGEGYAHSSSRRVSFAAPSRLRSPCHADSGAHMRVIASETWGSEEAHGNPPPLRPRKGKVPLKLPVWRWMLTSC